MRSTEKAKPLAGNPKQKTDEWNKTVSFQMPLVGWVLLNLWVIILSGFSMLVGYRVFLPPVPAGDGDQLSLKQLATGLKTTVEEAKTEDQAANRLLTEQAMVPQTLSDGTKEYDLTLSAFPWQVYPGMTVMVWGYNQQFPGPLIRLKVGEKVLFLVRNFLPQATTVHWHGLAVPNGQDGVPMVTQKLIQPGGEFRYSFTVTSQMVGTHLYHSHANDDFQVDKGLHGVLIVDPAGPIRKDCDVDALYEIGAMKLGGSYTENLFTLDGKAYPEAPALRVAQGERVKLRLVNASAEENHVMHLHGYTFQVIALDGNPLAHPYLANTVLLAPSQTADILVKADNPGVWMFHCHILDHMVNPGPSGDGSETEMADMGGLMTYLQVVPGVGAQPGYVAACSLSTDPVCSKP